MAFGALAAALRAGKTSWKHTDNKGRRPRPISSGPKRGRPTRRVMTNPPRAVRGVPRRKGRGTFAGRLVRGTHARRR